MTLTKPHHQSHTTTTHSSHLYDSSTTAALTGTCLTDLAVPDFATSASTTPSFTFDPGAVSSGVTAAALYLIEPGNTAAIAVTDLHQDALNDCFLISSIGELVLTDPKFIYNMIKPNAGGTTETVTLYEEANGKVPTPNYTGSFKAVTEVVTNKFAPDSVDSGPTQDVVNGVKEIWPQVLEQAVAQLDGGISVLNKGGYPVVAMEELTGVAATALINPAKALTPGALFTKLESAVKADDMIIFDTVEKPKGYELKDNHSYMFDGIVGTGASAKVKLLNPWGVDQPQLVPLSGLAGNINEIDFGHY